MVYWKVAVVVATLPTESSARAVRVYWPAAGGTQLASIRSKRGVQMGLKSHVCRSVPFQRSLTDCKSPSMSNASSLNDMGVPGETSKFALLPESNWMVGAVGGTNMMEDGPENGMVAPLTETGRAKQ